MKNTQPLAHLLASTPTPTDTALITAWLSSVRGQSYSTLSEMYRECRTALDSLGFTGGLRSRHNSISAVSQYYQPRAIDGTEVRRYSALRSWEQDLHIECAQGEYYVTSYAG